MNPIVSQSVFPFVFVMASLLFPLVPTQQNQQKDVASMAFKAKKAKPTTPQDSTSKCTQYTVSNTCIGA